MSTDEREPIAHEPGEAPAMRSLSAMLFQGAEAFGEATAGLGALAGGMGKLKEAFGGGDQSTVEESPPQAPPTDPKTP
jgi:hypothetical protein